MLTYNVKLPAASDSFYIKIPATTDSVHVKLPIPCFSIVSAVIGDPNPEETIICFNKERFVTGCGNVNPTPGFNFNVNGSGVDQQGFVEPVGTDCMKYLSRILGDNGIDSDAIITVDYNGTTCTAQGDSECGLKAFTHYPVTNRIYHVTDARIGNIDNSTLEITFDENAASVGNNLRVFVNGSPRGYVGQNIVAGRVRLPLSSPVTFSDTVTLDNITVTNSTQSVSGRILRKFVDYSVLNVVPFFVP